MLDIKFVRNNPEVVKENIRKKFQDRKLPLVDEVIELDKQSRAAQQEASDLRASRNKISKSIGGLMAQGKKEEAEEMKKRWPNRPTAWPSWKSWKRSFRKRSPKS